MKEERVKTLISAAKRALIEGQHQRDCPALIKAGNTDGMWVAERPVVDIDVSKCTCWKKELRDALRLKDKEIGL